MAGWTSDILKERDKGLKQEKGGDSALPLTIYSRSTSGHWNTPSKLSSLLGISALLSATLLCDEIESKYLPSRPSFDQQLNLGDLCTSLTDAAQGPALQKKSSNYTETDDWNSKKNPLCSSIWNKG